VRRVLACLAALALAGCGDAGTTAAPPATSPPAATSTPASDREAADAVFTDFVTAQGLTSHGSPEDLIALALAVCDAYDRGVGVADVVASLEASGFDPYEAGQVNGAATATYCPEHEDAASGT
jgi:predicted small lipoprotein YifL